MIIRVDSYKEDVADIIDQYESLGLVYHSREPIDSDAVSLFFTADKSTGLDVASNDSSVTAFLEFEDGTTSQLHIRKDRHFI